MPNILVGVPSYDGWMRCEVALFLGHVPRQNVLIRRHQPLDVARNFLVSEARRRKADVLFMLDTDADPAEGTFEALRDAVLAEPCIAAVPYCSGSGHVCVYLPLPDGLPGEMPIGVEDAVTRTGLHPVANVGTHCVAYSVSIFDRVKPPWFEHGVNETKSLLLETEDVIGHRRLREAGVPVYCDFSHWAGHWKEVRKDKPEVLTAEQLRQALMMLTVPAVPG